MTKFYSVPIVLAALYISVFSDLSVVHFRQYQTVNAVSNAQLMVAIRTF